MKKIKFLICILLTLGTVLSVCGTSDVVLANDHTLFTVTSFGFIDHHARVNVDFMGYENTTILRVDVKIEKQNFLFFTETVVSESYDSQGKTYQNEFFYPLYEDGIYSCTVTYTVTDGNTEDRITFFDTQTFRNSDYSEHTHIWNVERIEPTYVQNGLERKFCYCGKYETTELEKLEYPAYSHTESEKQTISTGAFSDIANQSVSPSVPSAWGNSVLLNQTSDYFSYCNCLTCSWERSTAKIRAAEPPKPNTPRPTTVDPWKKQQEAYQNRNNINPYHINK